MKNMSRKTKKNPSLTTRKNLWHSKTEEKKYSRELRKLITQYGAELQEALTRATHTDITGKTSVDIAAFKAELDRIEADLLNGRGTDLTKEHAKTGMLLGIRYSDKSLKDAGVNDARS